MEESTLYSIPTGQRGKVPYVAFLPDNGGMYFMFHSYRPMGDSVGGKYLILHSYRTMEDSTLYCILIGQWRKVPYIAFLSANGGQYLILHYSYGTLEEST